MKAKFDWEQWRKPIEDKITDMVSELEEDTETEHDFIEVDEDKYIAIQLEYCAGATSTDHPTGQSFSDGDSIEILELSLHDVNGSDEPLENAPKQFVESLT